MRKVIGFHNPDEPYGFLSNWYLSDFSVEGVCYSSMEQYMMYSKALLFRDQEIAGEILATDQKLRRFHVGGAPPDHCLSGADRKVWSEYGIEGGSACHRGGGSGGMCGEGPDLGDRAFHA